MAEANERSRWDIPSRSLTGLSEVRFVVTAVPEPGTLVLAGLGGLMMLGLTIFRRRGAPTG